MPSLGALSSLLTWIAYFILALPPLWLLTLLILREKEYRKKGLAYFSVALLPLIILVYTNYTTFREKELKYVGSYSLTDYPNCSSCILILYKNNSYEVKNEGKNVEEGEWKYRTGSDYWIIDIGEFGQLGSGIYQYKHFNQIQEN